MLRRPTRVVVIANPNAGSRRRRIVPDIEETLRGHALPFELVETRGPGDATIVAREAAAGGADLVVAAGGDGTAHEVAAGLLGTDAPMAVAPCGTMNLLARVLGCPTDAAAAIEAVLEGAIVLDVKPGLANDRPFLLMAGIGFDAWVLRALLRSRARKVGFGSYALGAAGGLVTYPFPKLACRTKDATVFGHTVIVGRAPLYGGFLRPTPGASLLGARLEMCVFAGDRKAFLRSIPRLWSGSHVDDESVTVMPVDAVEVTGIRSGVPYQLDGELAGELPARVTISDLALRLVAPRRVDTGGAGR